MRILQTIAAGLLALCLLALCGAASASALDFPPLTGRVVDQAGILNADIKSDIAEKSKDLEEKSGHPARGRHGAVAARQRHRDLCQ